MPTAPSVVRMIADRLRAVGCVFAEDEARLLVAEATSPARLEELVALRASGLPLEQVVGWAEFCGLRIVVTPGVFVPRRRTEALVGEAVALARTQGRRPAVVLDVCCGSGAVGAAVASALEDVELHAVDLDPAAVACARRNLPPGGRAYLGDLYAPLPRSLRGRVDLLVANAPYVPTGQIRTLPPEARLHEARVALDGGADGLDISRRVVQEAPTWLATGGRLLVETSDEQAPQAVEMFARSGLAASVVRREETAATVVVGTMR